MFSHFALRLNRLDVPVDVLRLHLRITGAIPGSRWDTFDASESPRNAFCGRRLPSKWDQRFESAFLQRRVTSKPFWCCSPGSNRHRVWPRLAIGV
jgi:hypothetical protein